MDHLEQAVRTVHLRKNGTMTHDHLDTLMELKRKDGTAHHADEMTGPGFRKDEMWEAIRTLEAELRTLRADNATLERRRLNCHELMLSCWDQFAQLPDGYSTMDLSTLEDLEAALTDLELIDDDGKPQWDGLNAAIAAAKEK